jgi:hypothetical protein
LVHGYHVAFFWGAVLMAVALVVFVVLIDAKADDIPKQNAEEAVAVAA